MLNLAAKTILITGASSGIGEACARLCAAQGARLILMARRASRLESLADELQQEGKERPYLISLDVRVKEQVHQHLANLPLEWKNIDILINNAGLALDTLPLSEGIEDHWDTMIDTNIKGLLYVTRAVIPGFLSQGSGHIVNIGSIAGHECYPNGNVYSATKFAVHALSKSMRLDMQGKNVRVTEVAPGAVQTEFSTVRWNDPQKAEAFYSSFEPLRAEDVADAVVYAITRPGHVNVEQMIVMPTVQASVNHLFRAS